MKRLALLLLILSGCNTVAQTPKPTMNLETAVFILSATPSFDVTDVIVLTGTTMPFQLTYTPRPTATDYPVQSTLTPRPTYTPLATATDYPTPSQEPSFTPRPLPTRATAPELFRMLERPLPVMNSPVAILGVFCHFQYNFWIVRTYEMVLYHLDLDGLKEMWCIQHNGKLP